MLLRSVLPPLTALLLAFAASGQDQPGSSCDDDPAYRSFDFWLGEWEVFDESGVKLGENTITSEEAGCVLVERWVSASGSTGQSYNYYDPAARHWRQLWLSASEIIDYSGGLADDGAMRLEGHLTSRGDDAARTPFRGEWSPLPNGEVRQSFELYDEPSGEWANWFVGIYKPKGRSDTP